MAAARGVEPERHPSPGSGKHPRERRPHLCALADKRGAELGERCGRVVQDVEKLRHVARHQREVADVPVDRDPDPLCEARVSGSREQQGEECG